MQTDQTLRTRPTIDTLKTTVIGVFAILSSMLIREFLMEGTELITPHSRYSKVLYKAFWAALFLLVLMLLVAYMG